MHTERTGISVHKDAFQILYLSHSQNAFRCILLSCTCSLNGQSKIDLLAQKTLRGHHRYFAKQTYNIASGEDRNK